MNKKNIMRHLAIALLLLTSLVARSEDAPGLSAFAEEYWSAICSGDPQKIYALYDPEVFSNLSPAEADFIKESWMKGYGKTAEKQGDSYQITSKKLPESAHPFPEWRWAAKPEYQIEIQTFRNIPNGRTHLTMLAEMVAAKGNRFYIIRPVPPQEVLQKQLRKKAGDQVKSGH
ncbi:MAG TPA: hypothetical protein VNQ90_07985 [Chthoniobacteraceae bacterium]|nr:hypothetical protein [Chthoniobacteraceae bacterium]